MVEFLYHAIYTISSKRIQEPESPVNPAKRRKLTANKDTSKDAEKVGDDDASATPQSLVTHVRMYIIGEKYDIPSLKDYAAKGYFRTVPLHWKTPYFVQSIPLLYENTMPKDMSLKNIMLEFANFHRTVLAQRPEFVNILEICPAFGVDLFKFTAQYPDTRRVAYCCENCDEVYACQKCQHEYKSYEFFRVSELEDSEESADSYAAICGLSLCRSKIPVFDIVCQNCDDSDIRTIFLPFSANNTKS